MTLEQNLLSIGFEVSYDEADFFTTFSNESSLSILGKAKFLFLRGDESTGKTHLAHIFCKKFGARLLEGQALEQSFATIDSGNARFVIDDIDKLSADSQESLFHLYNLVKTESSGLLLLTSRRFLPDITSNPHGLRDWHSRLSSFQQAEIITSPPDDDLLLAFLRKNFQDRQIYAKSDVLNYILKNGRRDFATLLRLVEEAHKKMLSNRPNQVKLTKQLIAKALEML